MKWFPAHCAPGRFVYYTSYLRALGPEKRVHAGGPVEFLAGSLYRWPWRRFMPFFSVRVAFEKVLTSQTCFGPGGLGARGNWDTKP